MIAVFGILSLWIVAGILLGLAVGGMLLVPRALRRAHS